MRFPRQFTLRQLLIFVAGVSVFCSLAGTWWRRGIYQRDLVEDIRNRGYRSGTYYHWYWRAHTLSDETQNCFLARTLGKDMLFPVGAVELHYQRLDNPFLLRLSRLRQLVYLDLDFCEFEDPSLEWVTEMPQVRDLYLNGTNTSEAAIGNILQLARAGNLRAIALSGTAVPFSAIGRLRRDCPGLTVYYEPLDTPWLPESNPTGNSVSAE